MMGNGWKENANEESCQTCYKSHPINKQNQMSMNDSSLLDFLKKKSLFSNSPINRSKRSRSKSRQSQNVRPSGFNTFDPAPQKQPTQLFESPQHYQRPAPNYGDNNFMNNRREQQSTHQPFSYQYVQPNPQKSQFAYKPQSPPILTKSTVLVNPLNSSTFQSARVESAHCLENLSIKIDSQLQAINSKIDAFNTKMYRLLSSQFKNIQNRIYQIVEASFKETERCIRDYMKQKEDLLTVELRKSKVLLEREALKIQAMKEELQRPTWRKVAGEILSTGMETTLEAIIKQSNKIEIGQWQLQDFSGKSLRKIEAEIKEIFRIKT